MSAVAIQRMAKPEAERRIVSSRSTLCAATLGFFVITLDAVIVNVALPTIGSQLGATVGGLQWVVDAYTLMFAALLLSAGSVSDRIGARKAFSWGLIVFILGSAACGLARGLAFLIGARFLQGAGAAMLMPGSMSLIAQAYPDQAKRGRAVTVWAMGGAVASTSGPLLGGLLTSLEWRWIFFINLPVGLLTAALLLRAPRSPARAASIDSLSQVVAVIAMGALTFGAIELGAREPANPLVIGAFVVAAAALAAFIWLQRARSDPLVPGAVVASVNARIAMLIGFTFMVAYFGLPFVMSLYLQQQRSLSPLHAGFAFLPMMLVGLLLTPFSAAIVERWGARRSIVAGLACMTLGLALLWFFVGNADVLLIAGLMVLVGLGGPLVAPPVTAVLLASVPHGVAGTASGAFHTCRQLGGALAVAVFGTFLVRSQDFMTGLRWSLAIAASATLLTAAASLRLSAGQHRAARGRSAAGRRIRS